MEGIVRFTLLFALVACEGDPRTGAGDDALGAQVAPPMQDDPSVLTPLPTAAFHPSGRYLDRDGDGAGDPHLPTDDAASVSNADDCDDLSSSRAPGARELCNGVDDDCDGDVDEGDAIDPITWWADEDRDGHGIGDAVLACARPSWKHAAASGDCDDGDDRVHAGAIEVCNGKDDDCDGGIDESAAPATWYVDVDRDGYGLGATRSGCRPGAAWSERSGDCDDGDPAAFPGAPEVCDDGVDTDCDGESACSFADVEPFLHGSREGWFGSGGTAGLGDLDGDGRAEISASYWGGCPGPGLVFEAPFAGWLEERDAIARIDSSPDVDCTGYQVRNAGDLDGDGHDDLLASGRLAYQVPENVPAVWLLAGPVSGDVSAESAFARIDDGGGIVHAPGDLDGDGADDLVLTDEQPDYWAGWSGRTLFFAGPIAGELGPEDATASVTGRVWRGGPENHSGSLTGDFDGDGDPDVAIASRGAPDHGVLYFVFNPPSGEVALEDFDDRLAGTDAYPISYQIPVAGDLDGDGYDDLVLAPSDGLGLISGPFEGQRSADELYAEVTGARPADVGPYPTLADVDGDGDLEMAVHVRQRQDGWEHWLRVIDAPSGGHLEVSPGGPWYAGAIGLQVANGGDLDGDGADDLLVSDHSVEEPFLRAGGVYVLWGKDL